jgi:hypothetical protein
VSGNPDDIDRPTRGFGEYGDGGYTPSSSVKDGADAYLGPKRPENFEALMASPRTWGSNGMPRGMKQSCVEKVYIEHEAVTSEVDVDYRFGPFSSEDDARMAIKAVAAVVTQIATKTGWEIVKHREERTSVD